MTRATADGTRPGLALADVNAMDEDAFVAALGDLFEHSPWVARAALRAAGRSRRSPTCTARSRRPCGRRRASARSP